MMTGRPSKDTDSGAHPPAPPQQRSYGEPRSTSTLDDYHAVAETIGGPSLRWKDNVIQAVVILGCTGIGTLVGFLGWELMGAVIGGAGSMILSTLISGGVIMILGIVRAKKHLRNRGRE